MAEIIFLDGVRKSYRDKWFGRFDALKGISLKIEEGESFGFVGPNGAGKSTTIRILTGVVQSFEGEARVFGRSVRDHFSRKGLGYVPESPYLYDYLTPLEILEMGTRIHSVNCIDRRKHCMDWLDRFSLSHVANKRIRQFSKGMMQRTALAHAMACQPKLLILDEPLSGLDPLGRREVVDVLEEFRNKGGALFFSSHVLHDVERLADRFGLIHLGELQTVRTLNELLEHQGGYVVSYLGEVALPGAYPRGNGRWEVQVSAQDIWLVIDKVKFLGYRLQEVRSNMTLESVFMHFVDGGCPLVKQ